MVRPILGEPSGSFSNQKPDCVFVPVVFRHAAADVLGAGGHWWQASLGPNRNRHLLLQVGLYLPRASDSDVDYQHFYWAEISFESSGIDCKGVTA